MGGTIALRELCKMDKVKELAMTARFIDGNEALAIGMVTYVSDNPKELALSIAEEIKTQSPDSVAAVKKLYNRSWFGSKGSALMRESWYQIKILMGKNNRIKAYNQTHDNDKHKAFLPRKHW